MAMSPAILKRTLVVITAVLFSILPCAAQDDPSDQLTGIWTKTINGRTMTFTISADFTYEVEFAGDDGTDVWGSYEVSGTHISFSDEGGDYSAPEVGEYEFTVSGTSLTFTKVNDPLNGRSMLVEGMWSKSGEAEK